MTADDYIRHFHMIAHPEGGYYVETFRSGTNIRLPGFEGDRSLATSILFLLKSGQSSALHRIKSDELWYYHDGEGLEIVEIDEQGREVVTRLGKRCIDGEVLQHVVPAGRWFGARLAAEGSFCLVGCQVSPGFDFRDFELK
ncbi:MAG: cupin domain-containing protein [Bacteroidia bacterium]|nr:cupin domain-containing protein [Bacteroidia bacterium]MBP6009281.1 cupin domain-containing protein [Bacteroidia bacterium]MBP7270958.1 cupin domain-containing protein [Bacteroidia bacterium]MBP7436987.1 cupin domain-containing protein [Bacteroidia bacterium]MBP7771042.1 cupin domain-containing protein [Bacteroidia bacterium]